MSADPAPASGPRPSPVSPLRPAGPCSVQSEVDDSTTHVVAASLGTEKADAVRSPPAASPLSLLRRWGAQGARRSRCARHRVQAKRARGACALVGTSWVDLSYVAMERQPERQHMLRGPSEVAPVKEAVDARIQVNIAARETIPDADVVRARRVLRRFCDAGARC